MSTATAPEKLIQSVLRSSKSGNFHPLRQLLSAPENEVNFSDLVYKTTGDSVLHVAAAAGSTSDVLLLLGHFGSPRIVNWRNKDEKTPLHEACQFARGDNVRALVEEGADVNAIKRADWTPLMLACAKSGGDSAGIVEVLVKSGALVNVVNKDGWNALHLTARDGNVDVFRVLVQSGADVDAVTNNGRSVLHIAALHGNLDIVKCVLNLRPGSIEVKDNGGNTPLHEAVLGGHVAVCRILIHNKSKTDAKNSVGYSLLHLAASVGSLEMIEYLASEVKCDVNSVASKDLTPLHCAARKGHKDSYDLLVILGANRHAADAFGRLASDYLNS